LSNIYLPAYALPGQHIRTVIGWSKNHSHLPPLTPVKKLEEGYADFRSQTLFKSYYVTLDVWQNSKGIVTEETIDARNENNNNVTLEFTITNKAGLQLINIIYGQSIVNDFRKARYVDSVEIAGLLKFYQGKKYAYEVWRSGNSHQITIIPSKDLVNRIQNWKRQQ
jgi:hypothetical protein